MRWACVFVVAGCFNPEAKPCEIAPGQTSCAQPVDAAVDDGVDSDNGIDASNCIGSGFTSYCFATEPTQDDTMTRTIDTAVCDDVIMPTQGPHLCVRVARNWIISSTLRATGPRPLVLVAREMIHVTGTGVIDVASTRDSIGAGGQNLCSMNSGTNAADPSTASGGSGGGLTAPGGASGGGININGVGGAPGIPGGVIHVRGGCVGSRGGDYSDGATLHAGGLPGQGGGAVYLLASTILVEGKIHASGAGGGRAGQNAGGGGGGSGGFIGLDAASTTVAATATLRAIGGGGAGGGGPSGEGNFGTEAGDSNIATGGPGTAGSGYGGNGTDATGGSAGTTTAVNGGGGGGGGGSGGFIGIANPSAIVMGSIAPLPSPM